MPLVSRQAMASPIAAIWTANRDKDREAGSYSPSPRRLPSAGLWMEVTGSQEQQERKPREQVLEVSQWNGRLMANRSAQNCTQPLIRIHCGQFCNVAYRVGWG